MQCGSPLDSRLERANEYDLADHEIAPSVNPFCLRTILIVEVIWDYSAKLDTTAGHLECGEDLNTRLACTGKHHLKDSTRPYLSLVLSTYLRDREG